VGSFIAGEGNLFVSRSLVYANINGPGASSLDMFQLPEMMRMVVKVRPNRAKAVSLAHFVGVHSFRSTLRVGDVDGELSSSKPRTTASEGLTLDDRHH